MANRLATLAGMRGTAERERVAHAAEQRLTRDAKAYREAVAALEAARAKLTEAVRLADKAGVRQVNILRAIDNAWTREHIRKLLKP